MFIRFCYRIYIGFLSPFKEFGYPFGSIVAEHLAYHARKNVRIYYKFSYDCIPRILLMMYLMQIWTIFCNHSFEKHFWFYLVLDAYWRLISIILDFISWGYCQLRQKLLNWDCCCTFTPSHLIRKFVNDQSLIWNIKRKICMNKWIYTIHLNIIYKSFHYYFSIGY